MTQKHLSDFSSSILKNQLAIDLPASQQALVKEKYAVSRSEDLLVANQKEIINLRSNGEFLKLSEEEFKQYFACHYLKRLSFQTLDDLERCISQYPKIFEDGLISSNAEWSGALYREIIQLGEFAPSYIQYLDEDLGYGLFSFVDVEEFQIIGEYTGLVKHRKRLFPNTNAYCMYYPTGNFHWKVYMVDAQDQGNQSRFINHSDNPNLRMIYAFCDGILHMLFQAKRKILKNEEFTVDYGEDYWKNRIKISH